jgi:hypothetical protein
VNFRDRHIPRRWSSSRNAAQTVFSPYSSAGQKLIEDASLK